MTTTPTPPLPGLDALIDGVVYDRQRFTTPPAVPTCAYDPKDDDR